MAEEIDNREVIIDVDHLTKDYGYGRGVFDVSIKVHKGECYGYLGPNGAGKSTTIRHIMGFSKPQKGTIKIHGMETFSNTDKLLGEVGYLPGEPSIPKGLDGWGFLRMMQGMRDDKNEERLNYLLDLFKLNPGMSIKDMSLGEKRKLAVVAAFMNDPDVLILDEPTSGLDPIMQKVFIDFVVEEKKRGKTILLSSHIFSEIEATCDVISIIKDGVHVSTFKAKDIKRRKEASYILTFQTLEGMHQYLEKCPFKVLDSNEVEKKVTVEFLRKEQFHDFFESLMGYKVKQFEEKKYTLQDYFISFYKEEKEFGGLEGVVGNKK